MIEESTGKHGSGLMCCCFDLLQVFICMIVTTCMVCHSIILDLVLQGSCLVPCLYIESGGVQELTQVLVMLKLLLRQVLACYISKGSIMYCQGLHQVVTTQPCFGLVWHHGFELCINLPLLWLLQQDYRGCMLQWSDIKDVEPFGCLIVMMM
ncbi:uncharacterized protein LOC127107521 isoform X2 [Lathyrus oleraceus]|uniref:uncharacterized protein LOC127107521 isoform X2 n=1 Tax=Pisum sativum TaxID=3888 RepID=UPI0021D2988F|nr:uncharacterized protein LOC127107521 isoform X2 [Pisum sativum]